MSVDINAIELELYRHLFASVAEEMGVALMRSSFSSNIKDRLDFSCAVCDAAGELIAQAAHIPVHLGAMPMSVQAAIAAFPELRPGDHVVLNDPFEGGTHLPDLTVVSPVHDAEGVIRLYVANRAHHADIGGISAGSLPLSTHIDEEGFRCGPTLSTRALEDALAAASRTPDERRGDLRAQLAANHRGVTRLRAELQRRGDALRHGAQALQDYSERLMRATLASLPDGQWTFTDVMDGDGHDAADIPIRCTLTISGDAATLDLRDAPPQVRGPINVPRAVSVSAALYALRCMIPQADVPTNAGMLRPLTILTTPGTLLHAVYPAAVAAGNVETSQRITDVIFGALAQAAPERAPAASCGTMNNVLMGGVDPRTTPPRPFAYYETIGGGSGATADGPGADAVQTHMTNTRNTPVETFERLYPVRVSRYAIRSGSGGAGQRRGGDGIVRAYTFDAPVEVTLMTERRAHAPTGLAGGHPGSPGHNTLTRDGHTTTLPAKHTFTTRPGDTLTIETPGGGGWGLASPPLRLSAALPLSRRPGEG